jgi:hypothetical protein
MSTSSKKLEKKANVSNLEVENYKDVTNPYTSYVLTTPFPLISMKYRPNELMNFNVGLDLNVSTANIGVMEFSYTQLFNYKRVDESADYVLPRTSNYESDIKVMYNYPLISSLERIERKSINIGRYKRTHYTGYLPMNIKVDVALRAGYDKSVYRYAPDIYSWIEQVSHSMKVGVIFQRRLATTFNTTIEGRDYKAAEFENQGIYLDASIMVNNRMSDSEYLLPTTSASLKKNPIGLALGYKFVVNYENLRSFNLQAELGVAPGSHIKYLNGGYVKLKLGVGLGFRKR